MRLPMRPTRSVQHTTAVCQHVCAEGFWKVVSGPADVCIAPPITCADGELLDAASGACLAAADLRKSALIACADGEVLDTSSGDCLAISMPAMGAAGISLSCSHA